MGATQCFSRNHESVAVRWTLVVERRLALGSPLPQLAGGEGLGVACQKVGYNGPLSPVTCCAIRLATFENFRRNTLWGRG